MQFLPPNSRRLYLQFALLLASIGTSVAHLHAQQPHSKGQEAQALQSEPSQEAQALQSKPGKEAATTPNKPRIHHKTQVAPTAPVGLPLQQDTHLEPHKAWGSNLDQHLAPQKPNRPIPVVLIVLGLLFILLWGGVLVGAILSTAVLSVILVIATIIFIPILILGIVCLIGGIAASFSKQK